MFQNPFVNACSLHLFTTGKTMKMQMRFLNKRMVYF